MHLKTPNPSFGTRILRVIHGRDARATSANYATTGQIKNSSKAARA